MANPRATRRSKATLAAAKASGTMLSVRSLGATSSTIEQADGAEPVRRPSERIRRVSQCPYKLLAVDLDGTLLDHNGEAHEQDVIAIKKLRARGVYVTIVTGRLYSGTQWSANLLGIVGPVGCADGSHIVHVQDNKTLFHRGITGRAASRLRASLERNDLIAFLFAQDSIVHDERGADYLPFVRTWSTDLRCAQRITEHALWNSELGMTAVVALGAEAHVSRTVSDIQRDATKSMQVAMFPFREGNQQWGMVARASGGTKATALAWIARHYGLHISETVCVGDWHNDLPMLSAGGRSFAMGHAPAEVKSAATDVLECTVATGGGIAEAIERAFR
ncbi:MAG: Cof-type HAD-IIB family hydrolase [Polyangiaceae bacterium]|nr:Cof-type HAD-IIB family hydrolase [Polyangiaceae bacterium]